MIDQAHYLSLPLYFILQITQRQELNPFIPFIIKREITANKTSTPSDEDNLLSFSLRPAFTTLAFQKLVALLIRLPLYSGLEKVLYATSELPATCQR